MAATGIPAAGLSGVLQLTWVRDQLAHVLDHCETDEPSGTWTGLACSDHGLALGTDVDTATLKRLSARAEIADLIWEAPTDLTAGHGQLLRGEPLRPTRPPCPNVHNIVLTDLTAGPCAPAQNSRPTPRMR